MKSGDAIHNQIMAARPDASTWLSANAGSGKTRVLTDRVARLLLSGVDPQNILCLTYTKAAAFEMQNRLFSRLGEWAMMPDAPLSAALDELGAVKGQNLRRARTLFAAAVETPGGLKIQTIHSFCAALLRRFPLEAGVSPNFTEIEERAAQLLRAQVLDEMAQDHAGAQALAGLARLYREDDFTKLMDEITRYSSQFRTLPRADALALFDLAPNSSVQTLHASTLGPGDGEMLADVCAIMAASGGRIDRDKAQILDGFDPLAQDALARLEAFFLTQKGAVNSKLPSKATRTASADLMDAFDALGARVAQAFEQRLALNAADATIALHDFGVRFARAYTQAKQLRGWLDFDDLIAKARALLNDPAVAAWVLYRLDGGIDHILVDEAQDTSPPQWDVIAQLAGELGAGDGTRPGASRTIFVVGDKKQSIYSFQGADPREFDRMQREFQTRIDAAGAPFQTRALAHSFRSSAAILRLVDQCFEHTHMMDARHVAFHSDLPGRVDLWPATPQVPKPEPAHFRDAVDKISPQHHHAVLADQIALNIKDMIAHETIPDVEDKTPVRRVITPGDILILVQRRSGIFPHLIRACKKHGLPIAGADRLKVGAEIAVRDLNALLAFLVTQDDSLALATVLRSPLLGWDEAQLFDLAHGRGKLPLWAALRARADAYPAEMMMLNDLRSRADFLRPYDLIERILTRHGGRARLLARLGAEATDGIDALLAQALDYERSQVPSLTGFLGWLDSDDVEIKRQVDAASDQIRVMTVHGAKGLEAPIVILPDCAVTKNEVRERIITVDGTPVWKSGADAQPAQITARIEVMKDSIWQEKLRLLYVALTRAEKWLIVAAAGNVQGKTNLSWYQIIEQAMEQAGALPAPMPGGAGLRLEHGQWRGAPLHPAARHRGGAVTAPADCTDEPIGEIPARARTISPSELGGDKALPGRQGMDEADALAYGTLVHQILDGAAPPPLPHTALQTQALAEAQLIRDDPRRAWIFGHEALSEVSLSAPFGAQRLHGTVDRLVITPDAVWVVDFKTNRVVPQVSEVVPSGILRQMAAYLHALVQIYPHKRIRLCVLWTQNGMLMELPHELLAKQLDDLGNDVSDLDAGTQAF